MGRRKKERQKRKNPMRKNGGRKEGRKEGRKHSTVRVQSTIYLTLPYCIEKEKNKGSLIQKKKKKKKKKKKDKATPNRCKVK